MPMSSRNLILLTICLFSALVSSTRADVLTWTNPTGGPFTTPTNWTPQEIPTPSDTASFDLSAQIYTVSFPTDITTAQLEIAHDAITFDLLTHTYNAGALTINDATLHLQTGQLLAPITADIGPHGTS